MYIYLSELTCAKLPWLTSLCGYRVAIIYKRFSDIPCLGTAVTCGGRVGLNLHAARHFYWYLVTICFMWNKASSNATMFALFVLICAQPMKQ